MARAHTVVELDPAPVRLRVRVRGAVQGVGFRPFAYGLATQLALSGFVRNGPDGVVLEIEGARAGEFLDRLRGAPPPLARIEAIDVERIAPLGAGGFAIAASEHGLARTRIVPDAAVCEDCLDDLFDPASRFHLYPFVTCTHCGPRFTLTRRLPYDRPQTSMAPFAMCAACARDYRDPANRRFHAEPIGCPSCGPVLSHPVGAIVSAIRAGQIVALKGIGGFHLMCDAGNERAVGELRRRKVREAKPFAVMVANLASLDRIAAPTAAERILLAQPTRPIVLMQNRGVLAPSVAPPLSRVGVVLPYAPLHHLIFHVAAGSPADRFVRQAPNDLVLVATSANPGGEPLVIADNEAREKLADIADLIVTHDRAIVTRDGHGRGDDGAAWGGEIMLVAGASWRRLGHLNPLALPGGDRAARSPWRMGLAALHVLGRLDRAAEIFAAIPAAAELARLMRNGLVTPPTTSTGRLFDAAAALLGVRLEQNYEGQAAAELEALVHSPRVLTNGYRVTGGVLDCRPLLAALTERGVDAREGAELFHGTLAEGLVDWIATVARVHGQGRVALGGGCMMNRVLTESLCARLRARSIVPLLARAVPPNDGGLSLGQAFIARRQIAMTGEGA